MEHVQKETNKTPAPKTPELRQTDQQLFQFHDHRTEATVQRNIQSLADQATVQKKNTTGMPDNLKSGVENLSGMDMSDVKVHYNSSQPAQLNAHAYAQGTNIHIAPGQEKHLPHEAWHVVQQKQGRVKPTVQMKPNVYVNDDTQLEAEATNYGKLALSSGRIETKDNSESQTGKKSIDIIQNVYQRQVFINGVQKEAHDGGMDIFNYRNPAWITDDYVRRYNSEEEYDAHDAGTPVKCGLLENMSLWYRLPFPSAVAGGPAQAFFLIGENHGYTPINSLLRASNQEGAKALVETSAVFRNTQMGVGVGAAANLSTLPAQPNRHHIELGLAKALHAFASMRAPSETKRNTAQPNTVAPYEVGGAALGVRHRMIGNAIQAAITLPAWTLEAAGQTRYRDKNGILYFLRQTADGLRGVKRPKAPGANNYNQGGAMEIFLRLPDILNALPMEARDAYTRVVESNIGERAGNTYERRYTRAYNALRAASINNIHTVYPGVQGNPAAVVGRSPAAGVAGAAAMEDSEIGMKHRNTVMLAGIQRAIIEGGYMVTSLGAQHVLDIQAWEAHNHGLGILIIPYNDFIRNYSTEA